MIVIWSELTFFSTRPVLSIFARIVNSARNHYDYFTIEVNLLLFIKQRLIELIYFLDCLLFEPCLFMFMCILYNIPFSYIQLFLFIALPFDG